MSPACNRIFCDLNSVEQVENCCNKIIPVLLNEGIWIAPTETIYGIMGNGVLDKTRKRVLGIKGRTDTKFIFFVRDIEHAGEIASFDELAFPGLFKYFANGRVTLVLLSKHDCSKSVALRIATDPIHRRLLEQVDAPILTTSANLSGDDFLDNPGEIYKSFSDKVDIMIDAGSMKNRTPSTIISLTDNIPKVLRHGLLAEEIINAFS